jgi:probable addiction module antidote protein
MPTITLPYDPAEDLADAQQQVVLLREAFASGEATYITVALGAVARARGMSTLADQTGLSRTSLYRALSDEGDPQLSTLLSVLAALGLKLDLASTAQSVDSNPVQAPALME